VSVDFRDRLELKARKVNEDFPVKLEHLESPEETVHQANAALKVTVVIEDQPVHAVLQELRDLQDLPDQLAVKSPEKQFQVILDLLVMPVNLVLLELLVKED